MISKIGSWNFYFITATMIIKIHLEAIISVKFPNGF